MSCDQVEHALEHDGLSGLTPKLRRHVDRCGHCQSVVEALDSLEESLRALPVPPVAARRVEPPLPSLDTLEVIAERRAEAAGIDWLQTMDRVEIVRKRQRFGVPPLRRRPLGVQLAVAGLAAIALLTVGLIAAVVWNDFNTAPNDAATTVVSGERSDAVEALDRR